MSAYQQRQAEAEAAAAAAQANSQGEDIASTEQQPTAPDLPPATKYEALQAAGEGIQIEGVSIWEGHCHDQADGTNYTAKVHKLEDGTFTASGGELTAQEYQPWWISSHASKEEAEDECTAWIDQMEECCQQHGGQPRDPLAGLGLQPADLAAVMGVLRPMQREHYKAMFIGSVLGGMFSNGFAPGDLDAAVNKAVLVADMAASRLMGENEAAH